MATVQEVLDELLKLNEDERGLDLQLHGMHYRFAGHMRIMVKDDEGVVDISEFSGERTHLLRAPGPPNCFDEG